MKCIFCGNSESKVVDSRYLKDSSIRRRRECLVCGKRFTTYETVETNPMVVTNADNMREPFKLEKLNEPATAHIEASIIKNAGSTNVVKQASLEAPIPSKLLPVSIADNIEKNFAKPKI